MNNVVIIITMSSQPTTLPEAPESRPTGALSPGSATGFALSPGADVTAAADIEGGGT